MNNNQNINREMSRSYFKIGLFIICITLAVFAYKTAFGYTKVKLYETYDNCTVTTSSKHHRTSKGGTATTYYVKVVREDPDYVYNCMDDMDESDRLFAIFGDDKRFNELDSFCSDHHINDLHQGNWGINEGGSFILIDFAGYGMI